MFGVSVDGGFGLIVGRGEKTQKWKKKSSLGEGEENNEVENRTVSRGPSSS